MTAVPPATDAERIIRVIRAYPRWSLFWDKKYGLWRAAEDDPDSDLYAESPDVDVDVVIQYITEHH